MGHEAKTMRQAVEPCTSLADLQPSWLLVPFDWLRINPQVFIIGRHKSPDLAMSWTIAI